MASEPYRLGFSLTKRREPFDLADIYHRLSLSGQLAGYEVHERFYEIGSHKGLAEAADYFKGGEAMGYAAAAHA